MTEGGRGPTQPALAFSYEGRPHEILEEVIDICDAIEIVPDCMLDKATDHIANQHAYDVQNVIDGRAIYAHGIGLSIGTVTSWNTNYLTTIESTISKFAIRWFSEHLGFTTVDGHFLGCMPAIPRTCEFVELIADRAANLRAQFGIEFLFEHVASPVDSGGNLTHGEFFNAVADASSCGLILDLHNLECEADNGRLNLVDFFDTIDFRHVREIHLAGGIWRDGLHLDVHSNLCAPTTNSLFESVVSKCPNLELVVFELLSQAIPRVGSYAIRQQLQSIRAILDGLSGKENDERIALSAVSAGSSTPRA
jgi:uncharacterized protein